MHASIQEKDATSQLLGALFVATMLLGCGASQSTQKSAGQDTGLDWAAGAPAVTPAYSDEEHARLGLCPMISRTVFLASELKAEGVPLREAKERLSDPPAEIVDVKDEKSAELLGQFVEGTYAQETGDIVSHIADIHALCAGELAGIAGERARRVVFCENRLFVATASNHWKDKLEVGEITERVGGLPGYAYEFVEFGYGPDGATPTFADFRACMR